MIIPGIVALLLSVLERLAKFRFKASPFLRRYFVSDVIYLLTGFLAGGTMAAAYIYQKVRTARFKLYNKQT